MNTTACSHLIKETEWVSSHYRMCHVIYYLSFTSSSSSSSSSSVSITFVNCSGKVAGGHVGITETDSTRERWCITYNKRAKLSEDTKTMFNVRGGKPGYDHRELEKATMSRDEEDAVLGGVVLYDGIYVKDATEKGYSSLS